MVALSLSRISPRLESVSEDADAELGEGDRRDPHFQAVCCHGLLGYYKEHTLSFRGNFRHLNGRARGWQLTAKRSSNFVWCHFP